MTHKEKAHYKIEVVETKITNIHLPVCQVSDVADNLN